MIHPFSPDATTTPGVRDGQLAPVTCAACGCRLQPVADEAHTAWRHFNPMAGRDARGCRVACADAHHDAAGRVIAYSPA